MARGLYILSPDQFPAIYGEAERDDIAAMVSMDSEVRSAESIRRNLSDLADIDLIFSGWGGPKLDEELLEAAPRLKAVFYGAGSVKGMVTDAFFDSGAVITSAYSANAIPVAEYSVSQIIFSLKRGWHYVLGTKREGRYPDKRDVPGAYGSTVGVVSLGMIGRKVCEMLKAYDLRVLAYDPYADADTAEILGVELCSLDDTFARSDVVSLHTPWLKETENMIGRRHFEAMKQDSSFINTARGAVVNETEMIEVLKRRTDIYCVLDVTHPEPPAQGSTLYALPNVVLTPHIAGSMGNERRRMGRFMVDELRRYLSGEPLKWQVTREMLVTMA